MRDSLVFYKSFQTAIKRLPEDQQLKALWAIIDYGLDGVEPKEDGLYLVAYDMAKPQVDANIERKANGYRGGRPVKYANVEKNDNYVEEKTVENSKKKVPHEDTSPVVGYIPLIDGTDYAVTELALAELQSLYPAVDAAQELRNIIGWNKSNPKNKKTRSGVTRHINSWFARAQNDATRKTQQKPEAKKNGFHNFEQRDTDYDALATQRIRERLGNG